MERQHEPHPVDIHVGQRLRQARLLKGMSQEDLGKHLGLTFQQVQKYEKGTNRISCSKLWTVSRALGQPVAWFFEGLDDDGRTAADAPAMSRAALKLATSFERIEDEPLRQTIATLVKAVAPDKPAEAASPGHTAPAVGHVAQSFTGFAPPAAE